jgi:hypothetical protein
MATVIELAVLGRQMKMCNCIHCRREREEKMAEYNRGWAAGNASRLYEQMFGKKEESEESSLIPLIRPRQSLQFEWGFADGKDVTRSRFYIPD